MSGVVLWSSNSHAPSWAVWQSQRGPHPCALGKTVKDGTKRSRQGAWRSSLARGTGGRR